MTRSWPYHPFSGSEAPLWSWPMTTSPPAARRQLLGRSVQLSELVGALEAVAGGTGRSFLIEGEAGIGKTSLLEEALEAGGRLGLWVSGSRRGAGAAAAVWSGRRLSGDRPDCRRRSAGRDRTAPGGGSGRDGLGAAGRGRPGRVPGGGEAILTLVEELSAQRPAVVAIDDLQWADPSTLLVLHRLGRSVHRLPVLLVGACRPLPSTGPGAAARQKGPGGVLP
jgi:hypothetical protein